MAKRHAYTARRATSIATGSPYVIIQRTQFETWHCFTSEELADAMTTKINESGRIPNDLGSGQRYFEKLRIFGFPDQYKHYDDMEKHLTA